MVRSGVVAEAVAATGRTHGGARRRRKLLTASARPCTAPGRAQGERVIQVPTTRAGWQAAGCPPNLALSPITLGQAGDLWHATDHLRRVSTGTCEADDDAPVAPAFDRRDRIFPGGLSRVGRTSPRLDRGGIAVTRLRQVDVPATHAAECKLQPSGITSRHGAPIVLRPHRDRPLAHGAHSELCRHPSPLSPPRERLSVPRA